MDGLKTLPEQFSHIDIKKVVHHAGHTIVYLEEKEGKNTIVKLRLHKKLAESKDEESHMNRMLRGVVANEIKMLKKVQSLGLSAPALIDSDLKQHLIRLEYKHDFELAEELLKREESNCEKSNLF